MSTKIAFRHWLFKKGMRLTEYNHFPVDRKQKTQKDYGSDNSRIRGTIPPKAVADILFTLNRKRQNEGR